MIQIDNTLISFNVFEKYFACDLQRCKGCCCVYGDWGAPLAKDEIEILPLIYPVIKPYLMPAGIRVIDKHGLYVLDNDGDYVTPIINGKDCAYSNTEKGIKYCVIEKMYIEGKINFRKPISCHLYPIRLTEYEAYTAVNYDIQSFCKPARECGTQQKIKVYQFLKDPLIRRFGNDWYEQLVYAANNLPFPH